MSTYFLKLELDENGGTIYQLMGVSQLLSVPYALFAENTAHPEDADADPANELQTISKDGQTVTLSNNGGSFTDEVNDADADPVNELQNLSQNGLDVVLSQGGGTISVADNDNDAANELQQLSKTGNTVSLSQNGGSFTDEVNDADANPTNELQNLSQNGLNVTLSQGGGTISVADNDNNPSNELQNISRDGLNVTISQGGGTVNIADNDNDPANEFQSLSNTKNGNLVNLAIANGTGTTINVSDTDDNPANELQTLSQNNYNISLSQGGGSFLSGVLSYTQAEIDAMTVYNGLTVHNSTTNCINYYFINHWYEACGTCIPQPTHSNAGADQHFTDATTTTALSANTPTSGTGTWSVISGEGGIFEDAASPNTNFTGQDCEEYVLQWAISTTCTTSTDNVTIGFDYQPTVPDAGPDYLGGGNDTITLAGNIPLQGEGLWHIISGEGGVLEDPFNPVSKFTGLVSVDYLLTWSISTSCYSLSDTVLIRIWSCGDPIIDERDGKAYSTVQIGTQCWMAQNINIGERINTNNNQYNDGIIQKYCYDNSEENCNIYGGMYQWDEMMQYSTIQGAQGICPPSGGWHLPAETDWITLFEFLGGYGMAPAKMKSTGTIEEGTGLWYSPNAGANNMSGFSALPGGRDGSGYLGHLACFWSTSGQKIELYSWSTGMDTGYWLWGGALSVRCLKDN